MCVCVCVCIWRDEIEAKKWEAPTYICSKLYSTSIEHTHLSICNKDKEEIHNNRVRMQTKKEKSHATYS